MKPLIAVPATLALVYRAWSRKSLTPLGIVVAAATAVAHAIHPWSVFFALLVAFFLGGTTVTKVKHDIKSRLTLSAAGSGEGPRTHIQVLANSFVASVLVLLHAWQLHERSESEKTGTTTRDNCWPWGGDLLVVGIVANYAAVAADTFSSELGILSHTRPRLITSPILRQVPPGTNGGVTLVGLLAGLLGAFTIAITASILLPFCGTKILVGSTLTDQLSGLNGGEGWGVRERGLFILAVTLWGCLGSLVDSLLGGFLQASVVDIRTGKVVEGAGGKRVLTHPSGPSSLYFSKVADLRQNLLHSEESKDRVERTSNSIHEEVPAKPTSVTGRNIDGEGTGDVGYTDEKGVRERIKGTGSNVYSKGHARKPSRAIAAGREILDNNQVNFLMALIMSLGGMAVTGWYWGIPLDRAFVY